jgi:hypothetical protein
LGPVLPTALPSGHIFASIVQATGSCGKIPAHPEKRSANSITIANIILFIFSPSLHYPVLDLYDLAFRKEKNEKEELFLFLRPA